MARFYPTGSGGIDTSEVTATSQDVLEGKKYIDSDGDLIEGSMKNRSINDGTTVGVTTSDPSPLWNNTRNNLELYTSSDGIKRWIVQPPQGYYVGGSYVGDLASDLGNATSANILHGKSATSENGVNMGGTMVNRGTVNHNLPVNGNYTIPQGYHDGKGSVSQSIETQGITTYTPTTYNQVINGGRYLTGSQTILGDSDLIASNIKKGVNIFGITGTWEGYVIEQKDIFKPYNNPYGLNLIVGTEHGMNNFVVNDVILLGYDGKYEGTCVTKTSSNVNLVNKSNMYIECYSDSTVGIGEFIVGLTDSWGTSRWASNAEMKSIGSNYENIVSSSTHVFNIPIPSQLKKDAILYIGFRNTESRINVVRIKNIWVI